ncbi:hypothetical protein ONZ51_g10652 [Trametes cubensis]|uniref:F-box domain-containing protein n=1 Tax=Trametes cubensis TaxID=1111947 RepID=A0AAD7TLN5_9APHY|nr:hypothetical protein ONZ51_g10652 [Trametes cubensis]
MPPRKKARTAKPKAPNNSTAVPNAGVSQTQDTSSPASTSAMQNQPRRAVRGRRGGLKDLPNMPLDILMEIVVLLHPRDLLNLARTSKEWRAFLMNRRQEPLWKTARMQQEPTLPDLPPFMSEPAYANLMFFKDCYGCGKPNAYKVYWIFGIRLCKHTCSDLLRLSFSTLHSEIHSMVVPEVGQTEYTYLAYAIVRDAHCSRNVQVAFLISEVELFRQQWQALTTKEEKLRFLKECNEVVMKRSEVAKELCDWDLARKQDRQHELQNVRDERFSAIKKRLSDEGWAEELVFMGSKELARLRDLAVKRPVKLTDRGT